MTLTKVKGDLLDLLVRGEVDFIGHCCNCQGVMGSGIALSIKEDFPDAYAAYRRYEESNGGLILGTISSDMGVYNLHAQNLYGVKGDTSRFVNYEALYLCLLQMKDEIDATLLSSIVSPKVGFPYKMAADRAGGDWDIVEAMIKSVFKNTDFSIVIVEFDGSRNA